MKILTLNCFLVPLFSPNPLKRIKQIADEIKKLNPDLIFLQEVPLLHYKHIFIKALSNYPFHYLPHVGFFKTGGGLAVFSKFPIIMKKFTKFRKSGFWTDITFFDKLLKKGFMEIEIKKGKEELYFFNTHLTVNHERGSKKDKRTDLIEKQTKQISNALSKIPKNKSCFLFGDFNFSPNSQIYKSFTNKNKLTDLSKNMGSSMKTSLYKSLFHYLISKEKIDYAFYKGKNKIKSKAKYVFNNIKLSDHKGLIVNVYS